MLLCRVVVVLFLHDSTYMCGERKSHILIICVIFFFSSLEPHSIPEFQIDEDPPGRVGRKFGRVVDL